MSITWEFLREWLWSSSIANDNINGYMHTSTHSSSRYVMDLRVSKSMLSVVKPKKIETASKNDIDQINSKESNRVHDSYDDGMNVDIPHEEPTGSVQQPISSVVAASTYEETFMRSIDVMSSKRIRKPSVKLREQTADCHISAGDGDRQTVKQLIRKDNSNEWKQAIDGDILSLPQTGLIDSFQNHLMRLLLATSGFSKRSSKLIDV